MHTPQNTIPTKGIKQLEKSGSDFSLTFPKVINDATCVLKKQQTNLNAFAEAVTDDGIAFDLPLACCSKYCL